MDSPTAFLEAFKSLCRMDKIQFNDEDTINLSNHVQEYIKSVSIRSKTDEKDDSILENHIERIITTMEEALKKYVGVQVSELSNVLKYKEVDKSRSETEDNKLLRAHIDLMIDLNLKGLLPGQPFYINPRFSYDTDSEKLINFEWDFHPFNIPPTIYESLTEPNKIFLRPPQSINNYRRFHQYLYYEEAKLVYCKRRYDLQGVTLTVHNEEFFFLDSYGLILEVGDRLIMRSDKYDFYLGAFIHDEYEDGYLIKLHKKIHREGVEGLKFEVYLVPEVYRVLCSRRQHAVKYTSMNLTTAGILFPDIKSNFDMMIPRICARLVGANKMNWFDERLNTEQRMAVIEILRAEARPAPFLLFGAPGTGRTTTVIEALLQIYKHDTRAKILICSYRDHELALRILELGLIKKEELWRLIAGYRLKAEMSEDLTEISQLSSAITPEMFRKFRVVISTCYQADRLRIFQDKFDYLFICDANLNDEPQCLISIRHLKQNGCLILVGDTCSGEVPCASEITRAKGFGVSLMERLSNRRPYKLRRYPNGGMSLDNRYKVTLTRNYRTDYRLMKPSNELFYNYLMVCDTKSPDWLLESMGAPNNPLLFHHVEAMTSDDFEERAWNPNELLVCLSYLRRLLSVGVKPEQICIVTPCQDQDFRLELMLETNFPDENLTVWNHSLSYPEREVFIISTVVSKSGVHNEEYSARQLNSLMTRAKWMVILIGNRNYLKTQPLGSRYLKYARELGF